MATQELKALGGMTEEQLREVATPWPKTVEELNDIIHALTERQHDYGTCVYAMSLAACAAYNLVAHKLGTTGFQSSCADLDFIRRNRMLKGPFAIIDGNDLLYPQYNVPQKVADLIDKWKPWAAEESAKLLEESGNTAHPDVAAHWQRLASTQETTSASAETQ